MYRLAKAGQRVALPGENNLLARRSALLTRRCDTNIFGGFPLGEVRAMGSDSGVFAVA